MSNGISEEMMLSVLEHKKGKNYMARSYAVGLRYFS
jgi:hypothetical protein